MNEFSVNIYKLQNGNHVVCFIDPASGKRVRRKFKTMVAAKEHRLELERLYQVKGLQAFASEPVGRLMEIHIQKCPKTGVRERKNSFIAFCDTFGAKKISEVGKTELRSWLLAYQAKNSLSDKTMNRIRSQFCYFFYFLKDEGIIQSNPLSEIRFRRNAPMVRPRIVLSIEEVKQILENAKAFDSKHLYPYLYTLANTGARRSEMLSLRREDIDFNTGLVHLHKTKNGKDRSIRMSTNLTALMTDHLAGHDSEFVFPNPTDQMVGRSQIQRLFDKFQKHFPMEKEWGLHALRHSFAYNYLKKGGEMYQLQAILGHSHIQTTVDIYGQLSAQDIQNVSPYED